MDKAKLLDILSSAYDQKSWQNVLVNVFSVKNIYQIPISIPLPANDKADSAYEIAKFITADEREIGVYQVNIKSGVRLEKNKVGLRQLLRSIYKYEVDGALIVFVQNEKWRLSFVSEIRVRNEEGGTEKKETEPKRYTYLLGEGEKTRTARDRLFSIAGKLINLEDIRDAFSVEKLNEEFYQTVAQYFYKLVGATAGKGKTQTVHERIMKLPSAADDNNKLYHEFAVRLIGRIIFCWFLKMKKSEAGNPLLPENLLSSDAVRNNYGYYSNILERLFFQTLNTPMKERLKNLPPGCENIPFLNGGLFEPHNDDYFKPDNYSGMSSAYALQIPDSWFAELYTELEKYNFTIDENSINDMEVSVDPEMLGRIFENLLAEIDPDSGETARKATGSFYTPREIVDYMATESLVHFLHKETGIEKDKIELLFKSDIELKDETITEKKSKILDALDKVKILDPACGSGAFPMGVLQKIVTALQKLDPDCKLWIKRQLDRIDNPIFKKQAGEKLKNASVEYARKLGVIQNSLYGVDIQPIAAEISKLRCFLTLVVDEKIDETKENRGVEALPNLEFKFVTADTLIKLPEEIDHGGLFNLNDELDKLKDLRKCYLQSYGKEKAKLKKEFEDLQEEMLAQQFTMGESIDYESKAYKISTWKPFSHEKSEWFDPLWMFGINGFDIVIGNPPYVDIKNLPPVDVKYYFKTFKTTEKRINLYAIFIEQGLSFLNKSGNLVFINPNSILVNESYKKLRKLIVNKVDKIIKLPDSVFKAVVVETLILQVSNQESDNCVKGKYFANHDKIDFGNISFVEINRDKWIRDESSRFNIFNDDKTLQILNKIEIGTEPISDYVDFTLGITPYDKYKGHTEDLIKNREFHSDKKLSKDYVPLISGKNIHKYYITTEIEEYLKYGNWLGAPREQKFFENSKIVVRQILAGNDQRIIAGYSNTPVYFTQIGFSLISKSGNENDLKFLLSILNSNLMSYYHRSKFLDKEKIVFQKILIANCKVFPIKITSSKKEFITVVDKILEAKRKNPDANTTVYEKEIDQLVYKLYELTDEEIKIVEGIE